MATVILIDWDGTPRAKNIDSMPKCLLCVGGERQGGCAFVSLNQDFILTDYVYNHREVEHLKHILNVNNLSYRAIGNIDLPTVGEYLWRTALNGHAKLNIKKQHQKKGA